jgi:hypothetical protein
MKLITYKYLEDSCAIVTLLLHQSVFAHSQICQTFTQMLGVLLNFMLSYYQVLVFCKVVCGCATVM